jgi:hypothetical protein
MTVLDPTVLRSALGLLPLLPEIPAWTLGDALLQDLESAERLGRVVSIRHWSEQWTRVGKGEVDYEEITPGRPGETAAEHGSRAVTVAHGLFELAVEAATTAQTKAAEQADRNRRYPAGMPAQRVTTR